MQVTLVKITARRTSRDLVNEKEEVLRILPESQDEYFERLARILAPEEWESE